MTKPNAVELKDVSLKLGQNVILDNLSFCVPQGEIFGLVGHNGAGKTSLLKIMLGMIVSYTGSLMFFNDTDLEKQRAKIGSVMDMLKTEKRISASKYVARLAYMTGQNDKSYINNLLHKVGADNTGNKPIGNFSLGMKRRLDIACSMINSPDLLILDEPFNGIDPKGVNEIRILLQQLAFEGTTIFVTSHNISELMKFATVFGVINRGKITDVISSSELHAYEQYKYVVKIKNQTAFTENAEQLSRDITYNFISPDEINIFGSDEKEISDHLSKIQQFIEGTPQKVLMNEEEVLLWKMGIQK